MNKILIFLFEKNLLELSASFQNEVSKVTLYGLLFKIRSSFIPYIWLFFVVFWIHWWILTQTTAVSIKNMSYSCLMSGFVFADCIICFRWAGISRDSWKQKISRFQICVWTAENKKLLEQLCHFMVFLCICSYETINKISDML